MPSLPLCASDDALAPKLDISLDGRAVGFDPTADLLNQPGSTSAGAPQPL